MSDVMVAPRAKVEEKLFQNRYLVDARQAKSSGTIHAVVSASCISSDEVSTF